jgi:hypothetical protein
VDQELEVFVVPRPRVGVQYASESSVLWARVEGKKQWDALKRFRPSPTLVLREGDTTRATALWALDRPLGLEWTRRGCERLAYRLRSARKWADPDGFCVVPPGACLRDGRKRPVPILVAYCSDGIFSPRQVVGGLKDAPALDSWREKRAA